MSQSTNIPIKILERITEAIIALDNDNFITYINQKAAAFWNRSAGDLLGKNIWQSFPEQVEGEFYNFCKEAKEKQQLISNRKFRVEENGWLELNIYPSLDGLSIIIRNIINDDFLQKELYNAAEELRQSSERFDLVTMATNDMIWDWDFSTDNVWWNHNFNNFFGYDKETSHHHIGSWVNNIHEDDRRRTVESIYGVINSGKKYWSEEYRYLKKDGTVLNIFDRGYVSHNAEGKPYRMIGSMINITERIIAEKEIKESEEKYRTLVDQASDGIFITDKTGAIYKVNASTCKMLQYSEEELLKMNISNFVYPEEILSKPFRFDELEKGKTLVVERKLKVRDGREFHFECSSNMLSDGRVLVFIRDVSERIKAQNEILKQKIFSDSIINSLPGIFYIHDEKGVFLKWNDNFEKVTGFSSRDIGNMNPLDFFGSEEKKIMAEKLNTVFNGSNAEIEISYLAKCKEEIPYQTILSNVMFEDKNCVIAIGIDITQKRKSEELLKKSYDDVRNLVSHVIKVREEERKRIGREIHDELGQQLTAIKMDVVWIDKKIPDENDPIKNNLKNILEIINGSNKSVRRILNELSPGVIDNFGLVEALEQQNQQFFTSTGVKIIFSTTVSEIDLSQDIANTIFRVYQESLTNIIRYAQATEVHTSLKLHDNNIFINVTDNGKGFDTTCIQSKKSFGILGMKERIISHNGSFDLHSETGIGTTITFNLPRSI
jgi:PAS domain S-box-containing protein